MEQHFVHFLSPGSFFSEETRKPIAAWDAEAAVALSSEINERHGAKPYGFYFSTRERSPDDLDSRQTATSPMFYLGGKVETREEVEARNDPKEEILRSNMRINDYKRIITNTNSWKITQPLNEKDTVLPAPAWAAKTGA